VAQTEPKLFPKARNTNTANWQIAALALTAIALGAGAFGYGQYAGVRTLKAQLAAATAAATRADADAMTLRSQLSAAQERINSQGSKLTAAKEQASTEREQLDAVQQAAEAEKRRLAAAQQKVNQEQHALTSAKRQVEEQKRALIAAESLPELPVRLVFFDAARLGAKVAFLQNLSNSDLDLTLDVESPGNNTHVHKQLALSAHGSLRMGPAQGYVLTPGQVITLNNVKFRRVVRMVT
jgi:hypothetical protein